jgi:hypothetical protein
MHPYVFSDKEKACDHSFLFDVIFYVKFMFQYRVSFGPPGSQTSSHTNAVEQAVETKTIRKLPVDGRGRRSIAP